MSLLWRLHCYGLVHRSSELIPGRHLNIGEIFSCLSTWVFSDIWWSSEHCPWHTAVKPNDVAKSALAFFVAAVKARLQPVDGWWWSALTPYRSCSGGCLWLTVLAEVKTVPSAMLHDQSVFPLSCYFRVTASWKIFDFSSLSELGDKMTDVTFSLFQSEQQ